jgi:5'-3' exonuclease
MGVRGLYSFIKSIRKKANLQPNKNLRVGVDAFCVIYMFREERVGFEKYLRGLVSKGYQLTFAFDRRAQKEKKAVVEERKQKKEEAKQEASTLQTFANSDDFQELDEEFQRTILQQINKKEWESWALYAEYTEWLYSLLHTLEISIVKADEEADIYLAKGGFDIVISSDTDMFVLGCPRVWMPRGKDIQHDEYLLGDVEKHIGLSHETFCELAYLVGCDVQPKRKMVLEEAISNLRFYGSLLGIHMKDSKKVTTEDLEEFARLKQAVWT